MMEISAGDNHNSDSQRGLVRAIGVMSVAVTIGMCYMLARWPLIFISVFAGAAFLSLLSQWHHPKTKWGKVLHSIFAILTYIFFGLIYLSGPALGVMCAIFGATIIAIFFILIVGGTYWLILDKPSFEMIIFLFVCIETILLSNHTDTMKKWMRKFGLWKVWGHDEVKKKLIAVGDYYFQTENMHFMVSFLYVLFLFLVAFLNISNNSHLFSDGIDNAIWKAFLVYIAYTTMMTRYQKTEAKTEDTAREMFNMFFKGRIDLEEGTDKEKNERMSASDPGVNNKEI